jgi:uncharacterized RDD family membrane protein YckC
MIYAGFFNRFLALCIDAVIVWLISFVLFRTIILIPVAIVAQLIYYIVFETSELRGTPGKILMGISISRTDGSRLSVRSSLIRYAGRWLSGLALGLGFLMALFTAKNQSLHDFLADTIVTEEKHSDLNMWDAWLKQFKVILGSFKDSPTTLVSETTKNPHTSLEELYNLFQKGILTEEEYRMKKEEYLKRL